MIRRRLRGILRTTIATRVPWTALGLVIGVLLQLDRGAGEYMVLGRPAPLIAAVGGAMGAAGAHAARWAVWRTRVLAEQVPAGTT